MREILFRGKRTDNGEWVYGSPIFQDGYALIRFWNSEEFEYEEHLVAPETVGQYTGLTDKNGKKIFEGDIVRCFGEAGDEHVVVIEWRQERAFFALKTLEKEPCDLHVDSSDFFMLLGNIHDSPELLKGDAE